MKLSVFEFLKEDHGSVEEVDTVQATQSLKMAADAIQQSVQSGDYKRAFELASRLEQLAASVATKIQTSMKTHMTKISSGDLPPTGDM